MDHHCPWLNNCVGFFNRKYFFQLICYTWVALTIALIAAAIPLTIMTISAINNNKMPAGYNWYDFVFLWIAFVMICVLLVTLTIFIEFHMTLIENNSTTIENLEEKSSGSGYANYHLLTNKQKGFSDATDDLIEFYWRDDIREYDVTNLGSNPPKFGIFEEDIELTIERLRHCPSFDNRKDPSTLAAVIITVLINPSNSRVWLIMPTENREGNVRMVINVVPIYFYVDWSITSNGKYLWTLAFVPIYLALNALLPMLLLKIGALLLRMSKNKRAEEFRKVIEHLNNRNFQHRRIRADYDNESFRLSFRKLQN